MSFLFDSLRAARAASSPASAAAATPVRLARPVRDRRLDFFRGLLQIFIFIAHVPGSWLTPVIHRNFGFSDSSELFVFLSGYTLASVFALKQIEKGWLDATLDMGMRTWKLYATHLVVFLLFCALVLTTGDAFHLADIRLQPLLDHPAEALIRAAELAYQPRFLDILPLFILLMLGLPLAGALAAIRPWLPLAVSGAVYLAERQFGPVFRTWPDGEPWVFDPLAWQFLFIAGATVGRHALAGGRPGAMRPVLFRLCAGFLLASAVVRISWTLNELDPAIPALFADLLWPFDKAGSEPLLVLHALALAYVTAALFPAGGSRFETPLARAVGAIGRHSLQVFCFGLFVSFLAHLLLRQSGGGLAPQLVAGLGGILLLAGFARLRDRVGRG